jgi:hypothetical protein
MEWCYSASPSVAPDWVVAAGVADHVWKIEEIVALLAS